MGVNPVVVFASVSAFIIGFAFIISSACSKYVEGLLMIFVRRPYNIGDLIHVSDPNSESSWLGAATWIVKDINLFTTTIIYYSTNEVASIPNSSLAASRIINAARSPEAVVLIYMKFPINVSYDKFMRFKEAIKEFMKARPREVELPCTFATRCCWFSNPTHFAPCLTSISTVVVTVGIPLHESRSGCGICGVHHCGPGECGCLIRIRFAVELRPNSNTLILLFVRDIYFYSSAS